MAADRGFFYCWPCPDDLAPGNPCFEAATPLDLLRRDPGRARDLARAAANTLGPLSRGAAFVTAPLIDRVSRAWLQRSANPYLAEIDAMAALLGIAGVYSLNVCFEWGCTTSVWPSPQGPVMRRVLDLEIPTLGEEPCCGASGRTGRANFQHHLAGTGGMLPSPGTGTVCHRHQSSPHTPPPARLSGRLGNKSSCRGKADEFAARPFGAKGLRDRDGLHRRQIDALSIARCGAGDLHPCRHEAGRRLRDRTHRNQFRLARNG